MRLEKIKLAGFKSFVDPTTVPMPSNLVGIVGPNGCGKSNVIDAVRWVMGESSAKMLRGESMADVIFNGSSSRKPVGTATIELLFDNAEGRAGGQYAQYNQISVKRQVSRDGQSNYYLNGTRCRRRDITDLFLGTGLGPRSYSIIEQGMISRLIEARPEQLRVYLEEAAGISKYKERRRDTENRIRHTRENLERLEDLRGEVAKQLQHLQRQAATAEKYQSYKAEERQLKAELLALRWRSLDEELQQRDRSIAEMENRLEQALTEQRRLEAGIEAHREQHTEANDLFNEVQGCFYAIGAEINGLEQSIQFARDARRQQQQDLEQVEQTWQESEAHRAQDQSRLEELNENLLREEPRLEEAQALEEEAALAVATAEEAMNAWQSQWEAFNQQAAEPAQSAQVERTRINNLEQRERDQVRRLQRFDEELAGLDEGPLQQEIADFERQQQEQQARAEVVQEQLDQTMQQIGEQRDANRQLAQRLDEVRAQLQGDKGRRASLEALQQAALGKQGDALSEWLEQSHLSRAARLAEQLEVESRWQRAVEIVLGFHLQAVCVENLDDLKEALAGLQQGALSLLDQTSVPPDAPEPPGDSLLGRIRSPWPLQNLLGGVRLAEDLDTALMMRRGLRSGESVITPEGAWLGPNWIRLTREEDESTGVLAREEELRRLSQLLEQGEANAAELAEQSEQGSSELQRIEQQREQLQSSFNEINRTLSGIASALSGKRTRAEHINQRREQLHREQQEILQQIETDREELELTRQRLHSALESIETLGNRRESLVVERDGLREALTQLRDRLNQQRAQSHQAALQIQSMHTAQQSLQQNLQRMSSQLDHLAQRREELRGTLAAAETPLEQQGEALEEKLVQRLAVEKELSEVRASLERVDQELRELEQQRQRIEQAVQTRRSELDQGRLQRQEVLVRCKTLEEQLRETDQTAEALFREMPEEAAEGVWRERLEKLANRIQRLGAINLAAIDEFKEQSERLAYLDEQHADISSALDTLEGAIRKIDRETRTRFKETFDKVNDGIKELFPRLFGGGHAYLELTGEDLLDTGVTVMARPPGKRNSSIQLLSGGEKALTAVAMVFAIFQLNPAPFCMLDEVDAPLDDANVGRFCQMVKAMSDKVQFIFITHNKITMEIANQLSGVTMHEPGVSRLVTVDVEEAAQLTAV